MFSLVMSPEAAELSYGEEEALRCGIPEFPATPQTKVELHCIDLDISAAEDEQKAENARRKRRSLPRAFTSCFPRKR